MSTFRLQDARRVRHAALALGMVALSICCLAFPAFAQGPELIAALPDAPSSSSPTPAVAYGTSSATANQSLTFGDRTHIYARDLFSPESLFGPAFGAAIGQAQNEPSGWHQDAEGYGKRFGTELATHTMMETIRFGVAAADGEDPRYFLSEDRSVGARIRHAVASTFVSRTSSGGRIPAFSRFVGTYGAAFVANTWYPDDRSTARYAAERGSTALGASVAFNLVREFLPFFRRDAK